MRGRQQNITSNVVIGDMRIQQGWTYIQGTGSTSFVEKTITFPAAFSAPPVVIAGKLGDLVSSFPDSIDDFSQASGNYAAANAITASSCKLGIFSRNAVNIGTSVVSGVSWIANGPA